MIILFLSGSVILYIESEMIYFPLGAFYSTYIYSFMRIPQIRDKRESGKNNSNILNRMEYNVTLSKLMQSRILNYPNPHSPTNLN